MYIEIINSNTIFKPYFRENMHDLQIFVAYNHCGNPYVHQFALHTLLLPPDTDT